MLQLFRKYTNSLTDRHVQRKQKGIFERDRRKRRSIPPKRKSDLFEQPERKSDLTVRKRRKKWLW